jgi:hypothetical protein
LPTTPVTKKKLRILLLGAYRPQNAQKRLIQLRDCMVGKGFESTRLAVDFDDKEHCKDFDEYFTKKSRKLIKNWADVPIFVFFQNADNSGVAIELAYTCFKVLDKQLCCAAFFEKMLEDFSTQVKGTIKITKKISWETFNDDADLCGLAYGHSRKILDKLFYYL